MSNDAHPILIKTAINMINQKLDDKLISSVTGLSLEEIAKLKSKAWKDMRGKTLRDLKYLKQNYKPSEIQKLLNSSKLKREVYQELKVSEYVLNNYIKHYKLSNIHKNGQRSLNKNSIGNENPKKVSIDNSIFREIENPVRRFQEILAKTKKTRILKELRDPYYWPQKYIVRKYTIVANRAQYYMP